MPLRPELQTQYDATMNEARGLRSAGQFREAEALYEKAGSLVAKEAGGDSELFLLSRYFVGLTRADRDENDGAVTALSEAYDGFKKLPAAKDAQRSIGAALGLSLLRARRWDETVDVLRRLAVTTVEDNTTASILHNLATALVRRGDAAMGLVFARQAVGIRARLDGVGHPLYLDTLLLEARAQVDAGELDAAAPVIRQAAQTVLSEAGEAHPFFADALLVEARRMAKKGDGTAGEALSRRALFAIKSSGTKEASVIATRARDAAEIPALWRMVKPAAGPKDVVLWKASMQHTLRRYQVNTLDFVESGNQPKLWYIFVPASVSPTDRAAAMQVAKVVFADANARLNAREPADPNFLDVTQIEATIPSVEELIATDMTAVFKKRVWEDSVAFGIVEGNRSVTLPPSQFAFALNAYVTLRGGKADVAAWTKLGVDAGELARAVSAPDVVMGETLWGARA